ncbi:MAG: hypothetical protein ACTTKO_07660 [Candidatus Limimorpha sp.]
MIWQYIIVAIIVAVAIGYMIRTFIRKTKSGGCSCEECSHKSATESGRQDCTCCNQEGCPLCKKK